MTRENTGARFVQGWERGFAPPAAAVLGTLASGYRRFLGAREWLYEQGVLRSRDLGRPVVAIGNLTVGGTGKTPAVEMAVQTLQRAPGLSDRDQRRLVIANREIRTMERLLGLLAEYGRDAPPTLETVF